jgi:large subunit ribosomal protein L10
MKVAKKTLMQLAAKEQGLPELEDKSLPGAIACIFSFEDPAIGAQVAFKYAKDHPQVSFVGGMFEGKILTQSDAKTFATIPSKQVLLATFAGMLQSPLRSFASMCNGPLTGFARAMSEVAKKKSA